MRTNAETRAEPCVWVISEVFAPDETATAHYMTGIAERLATSMPVRVLCVQPTYTRRGTRAPWEEIRNGVRIRRCWSTTLDKNKIVARLLNIVTIAGSIAFTALRRIRRGDLALVVTNPPVLPLLIQIACLLKGAQCVVRIDDIYSEMMVASGMLSKSSLRYRFMVTCSRWLYRKAGAIVVLGRDMQELVVQRAALPSGKVTVIPNWSDNREVQPSSRETNPLLQELGLSGKFVVQCAGNLGRVQAIETLVEAAAKLKEHPRIHFLFIGAGTKKGWIERQKQERGLDNITVLSPRPRNEQSIFLNACDIATTALTNGMWGAAVPSRLYNILAAAKPVLVVGDPRSEAALVVQENRIGWVASPGQVDHVAGAILAASQDPQRLREMGQTARKLAETKYDCASILQEYVEFTRKRMNLERKD